MIEGDIDFTFNENYTAIKFDDTSFYRKRFNKLPESKGVDDVPNIKVILFLEGDFSSISRSTKMVMDNLMFNIKKKLSWLECEVLVENLETQKRSYFIANRIHNAIHD